MYNFKKKNEIRWKIRIRQNMQNGRSLLTYTYFFFYFMNLMGLCLEAKYIEDIKHVMPAHTKCTSSMRSYVNTVGGGGLAQRELLTMYEVF